MWNGAEWCRVDEIDKMESVLTHKDSAQPLWWLLERNNKVIIAAFEFGGHHFKGEVGEGGKDRKPKRANENKMMGIQKQKKKERKAGK